MNMQAHLSGQISGQVPNQMSQQNGNPLQPQMQNFGGVGGGSVTGGGGSQHTFGMDAELFKARQFMQQKIYTILGSRHPQPMNDAQKIRYNDIVKRLEEGLFKSARTTDDYLNLDTLEQRLQVLIRRPTLNRSQQLQPHVTSTPSMSTMIPTPGMSNNGNSNMAMSSTDSSIVSANNYMGTTNVNTSLLQMGNGGLGGIHSGSLNTSDGSLSNGYQQSPAAFSVGSGGSNMSSMGGQRMSGQMIPTPGFNGNSNQLYMNMDSTNGGSFTTAQSTMVSQQQLQKQQIASQNSRLLHNIANHISSGTRSGMQQKPYAFTNGGLSRGLGMMGNNMQLGDQPASSEGYMSATSYSNLTKPLQPQLEQHQRPHMQGDGNGMNSYDSSGSGNFYGGVASVGSMMNTQNMGSVTLQSNTKTNTTLVNNQSGFRSIQEPSHMNPQLVEHSEKMNFQSSLSSQENVLHSSKQQQFQQQHPQVQPHQQFVNQQHQLKPQSRQEQLMVKNEPFDQTQLASNLGTQVKRESGMEYHGPVLQRQVSQQFQHREFQNQFSGDYSSGSQFLSTQSAQHDMCSSFSQNSQQIQQLHPQVVSAPKSDCSSVPAGDQAGLVIQNQWHPQSLERTQVLGNGSHEQHVQEDFHQRISDNDEAQPNKSSFGGLTSNQSTGTRCTEPPSSEGAISRYGNANRDLQFLNQQKWLLFLRHARNCTAAEGQCPEYNCVKAQKLIKHMDECTAVRCVYPKCQHTKVLISHHKSCRDPGCPVCVPVRKFCMKMKVRGRLDAGESSKILVSESKKDIQQSLKRVKLEQRPPSPVLEEEKIVSDSGTHDSQGSQDVRLQDNCHGEMSAQLKSDVPEVKLEDVPEVKLEGPLSSSQGNAFISKMEEDNTDGIYKKMPSEESIRSSDPSGFSKEENVEDKANDDPNHEIVTQPADNVAGTKSGKPKIKGVSLTELFTPEQVREHICGLRQWVGQSKSKAEKHQAMESSMSENSCQLCAVEKLTFEPPPIYCTPCGARIKRNAMYYTGGSGDTRHYFCIPCYNESRGDGIAVDGMNIPKARLEKKKNDEETEEWWVQCDKCEAWQHQICALFNGRRNDGGQAEYTCPNCYIEEVEKGERKPLAQSAVLGAKDLPKTILSDQIEQRLFRRLKQEREERARVQGKTINEVPGAEALVVRVVSSVDKKLEVKPRFLDLFREQNYPTEFPYKSKVVLLFQKIEGVEVCLFGMYVQEFGTESAFPNQRRVYLSYLDSVKYFRPEVKAVTGEALRTFVYHEILIGYLEYCKKRGFTSCYIWACPPLKGEDYILYCHPEIQKTPKSDKLREWYLSMLRKASREDIVVELTNLYDHFFVQAGECRAKVTAARLPYFDGDYWPGAAEDLIYQMQQEEDGRKYNRKGLTKKTITKRALKASGQSDLSGNTSKDLLLMRKLGDTISPMKEDFIMVHLQHCCNHCCILMVSGTRWVCQQCKNFQLCNKCYEAEHTREDRERHPVYHRDRHSFEPIEITDVPVDTKDKDDILESEFFDTRQAFLSLCQGNHYQYDTLRRAKHSSMMVLYHLHNPTAPAFVTTCNVCHLDIETGQGWRCEVCPDYDVCNDCYKKDGGVDHPHNLTNHPSVADRDAQNKEARQLRVQQLRKMLDLLVHASQCRSPQCLYPNCRKVKGLFRHGIQCRTRASGGCVLCKKMWYLLQLHARACKESECHVPRCRDLKEHLRRLQQQSDSRRRAAVNEMMRQRAAEVANNTG